MGSKIRCPNCRRKYDPTFVPSCPNCGAVETDDRSEPSPFRAVTESLAGGRPVPFWTVVDAVEEAGIDTGDDPEGFMEVVLRRLPTVIEMEDASLVDIAAAFAGVTFTSPISPDTWNDLLTQLDLTVISVLAESPRPLVVHGDPVAKTGQGGYRLHQQRWLWETTAETVAGFTLTPEGAIEIEAAMPPVTVMPERLVEHLRTTVEAHGSEDELARWEPIVFEALVTFEGLPTLLPPLTHLLDEAGYEVAGIDFVVPIGFDFDDVLSEAAGADSEEE